MKKEKILGAIFPLPESIANRIFDKKKKIFVKFTKMNQLKPDHKILFYASHGINQIIGEAVIESIEFLEPPNVLKKYRVDLFLTPEEFKKYTKERWSEGGLPKMLVIKLKNHKKYEKPIKPKTMVTVSGRYLTKQEYEYIISQLTLQ